MKSGRSDSGATWSVWTPGNPDSCNGEQSDKTTTQTSNAITEARNVNIRRSLKMVFVMNHAPRDGPNLQKIKNAILAIRPDTMIEIVEYIPNAILSRVVEFKPDLTLTFPLTSISTAAVFYMVKAISDCRIVCFRCESSNCVNEEMLNFMVGLEKYSKELVDYELFWGRSTADPVSNRLLQEGKISSLDRIKCVGSPEFEQYFSDQGFVHKPMPGHVENRLKQYPREKRILFVTGFHFADYTENEMLQAGDLVNTNKPNWQSDYEDAIKGAEFSRQLRVLWNNTVIEAAKANPEALFIVKTHPIENVIHTRKRCNPYAVLSEYPNILCINDPIPIADVLSECGILFHYGSTTVVDSYMLKIPSVWLTAMSIRHICSKRFDYYTVPNGFKSTIDGDVSNALEIVDRYLAGRIKFEMTPEIERTLENFLSIRPGVRYQPSHDIAELLLEICDQAPQSLSSDDPHFAKLVGGSFEMLMKYCGAGANECLAGGRFEMALSGYLNKALMYSRMANVKVPNLQYIRGECLYRLGLLPQAAEALKEELAGGDSRQAVDLLNKIESEINSSALSPDSQDRRKF